LRPVSHLESASKCLISRPDGEISRARAPAILRVATKTQITSEQYLRMTLEDDAEFVHGESVERSMPDYVRATIQALLAIVFGPLR